MGANSRAYAPHAPPGRLRRLGETLAIPVAILVAGLALWASVAIAPLAGVLVATPAVFLFAVGIQTRRRQRLREARLRAAHEHHGSTVELDGTSELLAEHFTSGASTDIRFGLIGTRLRAHVAVPGAAQPTVGHDGQVDIYTVDSPGRTQALAIGRSELDPMVPAIVTYSLPTLYGEGGRTVTGFTDALCIATLHETVHVVLDDEDETAPHDGHSSPWNAVLATCHHWVDPDGAHASQSTFVKAGLRDFF